MVCFKIKFNLNQNKINGLIGKIGYETAIEMSKILKVALKKIVETKNEVTKAINKIKINFSLKIKWKGLLYAICKGIFFHIFFADYL